jgi:hypothetical protein
VVTVIAEAGPESSDHHFDQDLDRLWICEAADGWRGEIFETELHDLET